MSKIIENHMKDDDFRENFLSLVYYESKRSGLDPDLVLSVIYVESRFKQNAVSTVGAMGYMQIMPFWVETIGLMSHDLFDMKTNIRYGCVILRYYLDIENGNVGRALGRYNGSVGKATYVDKVLHALENNVLPKIAFLKTKKVNTALEG